MPVHFAIDKTAFTMKFSILLLAIFACNNSQSVAPNTATSAAVSTASTNATPVASDSIVPPQYENGKLVTIRKSNEEWKKQLTSMEYYVLREQGTERAFTGDLWDNHQHGIYTCAACGLPLFSSDTKFDSGTGWPSFWKPLTDDCVKEVGDNSLGMTRTEVECARCGGHLGHVFDDGPKPTGLRYCMNSVSMNFVKN